MTPLEGAVTTPLGDWFCQAVMGDAGQVLMAGLPVGNEPMVVLAAAGATAQMLPIAANAATLLMLDMFAPFE